MTYSETCASFTQLAATKARTAARTPGAFFVGAMLAGAYVGVALLLALTCAAGLPPGVRPLVMGSVFGIGLILVVMSGAEMFTGHVMYATFGAIGRSVSALDLLRMLVLVWVGNLVGAVLLTAIFVGGGGGAIYAAAPPFLHDYVVKKETATVLQLLMRAILCNWLVCLAIWTAARVQNEAAKIIVIAWCLLAFVACGFEHSVADMTAVTLGLLAHPQLGDLPGALYNLTWVTLGNFIGGGVFVAGAYTWAARGDAAAATAAPSAKGPAVKASATPPGRPSSAKR